MAEDKGQISISTPPVADTNTDIEKDATATTSEKHMHDADEALTALEELQGDVITVDEETNKRLLGVIDWHLMPIMCCVYGMNYLDSTDSYLYTMFIQKIGRKGKERLTRIETAMSYASIMGFKQDLGLEGDNYQWLGSLFYFG